MTPVTRPSSALTLEDWLEQERTSRDERTEYLDGEIFAMSGGSAEHNAIISNISGQLWTQMKGRPCHVYASGMRLQIQQGRAGKYPDLMALCGEQQFHDGRRDLLLNPSVIGEVLSDSTEGYDRGEKFALYRRLPSLREYLLVSQHRVLVERYSRGQGGHWILSSFEDLADQVELESVGCTLALAEVYDKIVCEQGL